MKLLKSLIALTALMLVFTACEKPEYSLGDLPSASEIDYEVVQDFNTDPGGNTVILRYNSKGSSPVWDYETGKSTRAIDTVRYAFAGQYTIKLTAITPGGTIDLPPVTIDVTEDNLNYVNDPLWTALSGGVGNSKVWLLDIDASGLSKHFTSPQYFYGTDNGWLDGGDNGCYGDDCWNWNPTWADNTWIMPAADYGTMTFSLDGGPFVTTNHLTIPGRGEENGTFFLDIDAKTLTMSDATFLHPEGIESCISSFGELKVMSLTEDFLQLAALRKDDCDGAALLVYNFISKEFSDNWVPEDPGDPEPDEGFMPTFQPDELLTMLTGGPGTGRVWKLDGDGNPVDWLASGIGWTTGYASSQDWGWNSGWSDIAETAWVQFDQFGGTQTYTKFQGGEMTTGAFTIQEPSGEEVYTKVILEEAGTLVGNPDSWMNPTTSELTIVKAFNDSFEDNGIWFGTSYNPDNDEWLVFHYIINTTYGGGGGGGGGPTDNTESILTSTPWKLDMDRTFSGSVGGQAVQGPICFSDFASWSWNPAPGEHYASGEAGVDYGTVTFNSDYSVNVAQLRRIYTYDDGTGNMVVRNGSPQPGDVLDTEETVNLNGTWAYLPDDDKITMDVAMLHPWTCDYAVADWG
ncbi:MAG: hypothetical protein KDC54_06825, partial [Lewinella sp.]|nr:hypothetical protein [Lewinella sp.]